MQSKIRVELMPQLDNDNSNESDLTQSHCEACRIDATKVNEAEAISLQKHIPNWQRLDVQGIQQLQRTYTFPNFADALKFTNKVGAIAEDEGHHPAILTEWGEVKVSWWSHKIKGLHRNDFIMAAKTDRLYNA